MRLVDGIEITAVEAGRDVHVLGYFFDAAHQPLAAFLGRQRDARIARVRQIGERLEALKCPVDVAAILAEAARHPGRSVGRPSVADALVAAGHAVDRRDAFDRLLGADGPAFVPRCGPTVAEVVDVIAAAGGITSLAHPGLTRVDADLPRFVDAGLTRTRGPASRSQPRDRSALPRPGGSARHRGLGGLGFPWRRRSRHARRHLARRRRPRSARGARPAAPRRRCDSRGRCGVTPVLRLTASARVTRACGRFASTTSRSPRANASRSPASTAARPRCSSTSSPAPACRTRARSASSTSRRRRSRRETTGSRRSIASASSARAGCCSTVCRSSRTSRSCSRWRSIRSSRRRRRRSRPWRRPAASRTFRG